MASPLLSACLGRVTVVAPTIWGYKHPNHQTGGHSQIHMNIHISNKAIFVLLPPASCLLPLASCLMPSTCFLPPYLKLMQYSSPRFQVMLMISESRVNGIQRPASRMSLTERFIKR